MRRRHQARREVVVVGLWNRSERRMSPRQCQLIKGSAVAAKPGTKFRTGIADSVTGVQITTFRMGVFEQPAGYSSIRGASSVSFEFYIHW